MGISYRTANNDALVTALRALPRLHTPQFCTHQSLPLAAGTVMVATDVTTAPPAALALLVIDGGNTNHRQTSYGDEEQT